MPLGSIEDFFEHETVRGRRRARRCARAPVQQVRETGGRTSPHSDLDERTDQSTNHAAQEPVAGNPEKQLVPRFLPGGREDCTEGLAVRSAGEGWGLISSFTTAA